MMERVGEEWGEAGGVSWEREEEQGEEGGEWGQISGGERGKAHEGGGGKDGESWSAAAEVMISGGPRTGKISLVGVQRRQ